MEAGTIIDQYKVLLPIGKGGMGEVFLAQDTKLDRKVALKVLPPEFAEDHDRMRRFVREAKSASGLNHPNIITIYEIGESNGINFIATEFIEGETLQKHLKGENVSLRRVLDIAAQIAAALQTAHSAGIIHRDIKPENIMIRQDGLAKILDFGIAKLSQPKMSADASSEDATAIKPRSTSPGMIIGTANYMSPEQAEGKEVDARTDIFSFGVLLYEMIAGHLPFEGESAMKMIGAILHKEPKPLDGNVPTEITKIISKCLRKDRDKRYQTIKDVLIDVQDVKQELEFQDKLERSTGVNDDANKTKILQAATLDEIDQVTTNQTIAANSTKKYVTAGLLILILAVGGFFGFSYLFPSAGQIDSIAVMPFHNDSTSADSEYLSDGLVESLIYRLSQIDNLKVSPTSSVFRYKGKQTDSVSAGNELGVAAVMTGRIAQRGEDLIISVELVDIRNSKTLWGERYNRKISDLLATQQEITTEIVQKLKLKLAGEDQRILQKTYTTDNEAYKLYLKGKFQYAKQTKADGLKGIEYFKQAIEVDPNFALAYVGIANTYLSMASWGYFAPKENEQKAKAAAEKALEIDPDLAEAHAAVAWHAAVVEWDWQKAESEFKKAIELDPNIAETHHNYSFTYLLPMGHLKESLIEQKRALELEPLGIIYGSHVAFQYMYNGQPDKALEQIEATDNLDPGHPASSYYLGVIYIGGKMYDKAIALTEKRLEKDPNEQVFLEIAGFAYAKAGQRRKAEEIIERFREISKTQYIMPSSVAPIYAALGEKDKAITELEKAYEVRDPFILQLNIHPYFDDIRDDPRVIAMAKRIGLPERK